MTTLAADAKPKPWDDLPTFTFSVDRLLRRLHINKQDSPCSHLTSFLFSQTPSYTQTTIMCSWESLVLLLYEKHMSNAYRKHPHVLDSLVVVALHHSLHYLKEKCNKYKYVLVRYWKNTKRVCRFSVQSNADKADLND